MVTMFLIR